jgi:phosphatidylglycerophosphate synthase
MDLQSYAPRLLVDGRASTADGVDPTEALLGLSLLARIARAARRSGYGQIHVLAAPADAARFREALGDSDDVDVSAAPPAPGDARTVYVPGLVVAERGWLEAAALAPVRADGCMEFGSGVVVCGARAPLARFAGMPNGALGRRDAGAPLRIASRADLAPAERHLVRSLGKSTDGFMERNVERPLSRLLSRRLAKTAVTPNQMTLVSAAVGLAAAPFFLSHSTLWQTAGALIFLAHSILDGCDGELARLKFQESRWGGLLDYWCDNVVHAAIFACMALGWSRAVGAEWPLALGAAAVLGALGSASFVYWRVMRPKRAEGPLFVSVAKDTKNRLVSLMDSLSRRDFIYLVLALSMFGKAAWFLALAAVGAPIFLVLLLIVAAQEARSPSTAGT